MKILVTGASGFIGSHCCRLLEQHYDVVGVDRYINRTNNSNVEVRHRDLSENTDFLLEGFDVLIHFAAETFVDYSIKDPQRFIESNVIATFNLLESARKASLKRIIIISTDEVYGSIRQGYHHEGDMLSPGNPYSASKACADMLCLSYRNTYGLPITILRPENNYGTWQGTEKAIPTFIYNILKGKTVTLYGDGRHVRQWLHVEDFCNAVKYVLEDDTHNYKIINVGSKQERENIEILNIIKEYIGLPCDIKYVPDDIARPGHDRRYGISTARILDMGWKPKHKIEESIKPIIKWYIDNEWWFNDRI